MPPPARAEMPVSVWYAFEKKTLPKIALMREKQKNTPKAQKIPPKRRKKTPNFFWRAVWLVLVEHIRERGRL